MLRRTLLVPLCSVACSTASPTDSRVIVKVSDAALVRDSVRLQREVNARTGLVVSVGAAVADDTVSLSLRCATADGGCEQALAALRSSGLFESVETDRKVRRQ